MSVEALRIPADTASLLRQLGIETVDQLLSLPREDLPSRFGGALLRRLDQFTGAAREVIEPHRGLPPLTARWALDEPTADRAMLLHVLGELVERLARQLAARDLGAVILMCVLHASGGTLGACDGRGANVQTRSLAKPQDGLPEWAGGRIVPLRIGLVEPSADVRQLLELIELHLETVRLAGEVGRVEIRAAVVGRLGQRQRELFADRWPADPHQLALLVNRLSSRLGDEQVLRAELRASAVPERAFRYVPLTQCRERERGRGGDKKKASTRRSHLPISLSPCLPLLLHTQPQALEVVCIAPDGPPQFVWLEGRRERILHCAGPERIETLWWRGPSVRRDYYRIAAESGSHLWIFRRLTDRRWFLHGTFA